MSQDAAKNQDRNALTSANANNLILLGQSNQLDLSALSEPEKQQMVKRFAEGQIDTARMAGELAVENKALGQRLGDLVENVANASDAGASVTVTGAYTDKMGRTEVIMGNTETAAKGKLSRSQVGTKDMTLIYVIIAAIVVVIITAILMR